MDLAASVQHVTEEILLGMARNAHARTGMKNLVLAGGVALNCVANGRILRETPFEDIWIQPAAGDAGGALGVAQFIWHQLLDKPRTPGQPDGQKATYLGPAFGVEEVEHFLKSKSAVCRRFDDFDELCETVAGHLADEKVVGWNAGPNGIRPPRTRSPQHPRRRTKHEDAVGDEPEIKFRESFRPFAPSILEDRASEFFEIDPQHSSPYMLLVADVREEKRVGLEKKQAAMTGLDQLSVVRSSVPAITHVDIPRGSKRSIHSGTSATHRLLKAFEARTGSPVLINTSFNVRGEPIVCSAADAWNCFMATNMDVLVIENFVMLKSDQPNAVEHDPSEYLSKFRLD